MSSGKRLRSTPTFVRRGRPTQGRLKIYWLEYDLEEGSWSKATYAIQASCSSPDLIRKLESIITVESPTVLHPFRRMSWSPERRVTEAPNSELRCQGQDITNSCFESNRVSILNESARQIPTPLYVLNLRAQRALMSSTNELVFWIESSLEHALSPSSTSAHELSTTLKKNKPWNFSTPPKFSTTKFQIFFKLKLKSEYFRTFDFQTKTPPCRNTFENWPPKKLLRKFS